MTVRPAGVADAPGIARVHVESWRTTYRGIIPEGFLAGLSSESRERYWTQALTQADGRRPVYVAEDEAGKIAGFAAGGPEREQDAGFQGEVYAIYVLAAHQRQGIGGGLFRAVAARLAEAGMASLLVWVLAANPARRFYAALGGEPVRERRIEIGGATLDEVAYGWADTRGLTRGDAHPND